MLRNTLKKKAVRAEQFKKSLSYSEAVVTDKFQIKKCLAEFPSVHGCICLSRCSCKVTYNLPVKGGIFNLEIVFVFCCLT